METHSILLLLPCLQPTDTHVKHSDTHDLEAMVSTNGGREELGITQCLLVCFLIHYQSSPTGCWKQMYTQISLDFNLIFKMSIFCIFKINNTAWQVVNPNGPHPNKIEGVVPLNIGLVLGEEGLIYPQVEVICFPQLLACFLKKKEMWLTKKFFR